MTIKIKIGSDNKELQNDYDEKGQPVAKADLQIKRDMAGNYIITDHSDMDITIITKKGRIVTIPKIEDGSDDTAYASQNRFYKFLSQQGIVDPTTIQGGSIIGTIEAKMLKPKKDTINPIQVAIFTISKFIDEERPYFMFKQGFEEREDERNLNPDDEHSTELGEVPHQDRQGSIDPNYWATGSNFRIFEQNLDEASIKDYHLGAFDIGKHEGDFYVTFNDRFGRIIISLKKTKNPNKRIKYALNPNTDEDYNYIKAALTGADEHMKYIALLEVFKQKFGNLHRYTDGSKEVNTLPYANGKEVEPEQDSELDFTFEDL